jgi:hypothetical protein
MAKNLNVLAVVHLGRYEPDGNVLKVVDDECPCCRWDPWSTPEGQAMRVGQEREADPEWKLGEMWAPGAERGIGADYQIFHCQKCGLVYATHLN